MCRLALTIAKANPVQVKKSLAPLLHHEPLTLLFSETEGAYGSGFGHLAARGLNVAEDLAALADQ